MSYFSHLHRRLHSTSPKPSKPLGRFERKTLPATLFILLVGIFSSACVSVRVQNLSLAQGLGSNSTLWGA